MSERELSCYLQLYLISGIFSEEWAKKTEKKKSPLVHTKMLCCSLGTNLSVSSFPVLLRVHNGQDMSIYEVEAI